MPVELTVAGGLEPPTPPARVVRVWPIEGRPLAAADGIAGGGRVVQLVDVDGATVRWIDRSVCVDAVVHTTADRILCAGFQGIRALDVDSGAEVWSSPLMFRAAQSGLVFGRDPHDERRGQILEVATGRTLVTVAAPADDTFDDARRVCPRGGGYDVFAWSASGMLRRLHVAGAGPSAMQMERLWSRRLPGAPAAVDACEDVVLVDVTEAGTPHSSLWALSRKTGRDVGGPVRIRGWWPARDPDERGRGAVELATDEGIEVRTRALEPVRMALPGVVAGRLLGSWRSLRAVQSPSSALVLLDGDGVRAQLAAPANHGAAVLTSAHLLAGAWLPPRQSTADRLALYRVPPQSPKQPTAEAVAPSAGPLDAERPVPRKVPPQAPPSLAGAIEQPGAGAHAVGPVTLASDSLYAVSYERRPGPDSGAGVAAFDLRARRWQWHRPDACPRAATVVGVAVAADVVVCGGRRHYPAPGEVVAVRRADGSPAWRAELPTVDRLAAAGAVVLAWHGEVLTVLDAATGAPRWQLPADNGHLARAIPLVTGGETVVLALESPPAGGTGARLVARAADGTPRWGRTVPGYAIDLMPLAEAAGVALADGSLLVVDAATGDGRSIDGPSRHWQPAGGHLLVSAHASGDDLVVRAQDLGGRARFHNLLWTAGAWSVAPLRAGEAALALVTRFGGPRVMLLDPTTGAVTARHALPGRAILDGVFTAAPGGRPVAGVVLQKPLGIRFF